MFQKHCVVGSIPTLRTKHIFWKLEGRLESDKLIALLVTVVIGVVTILISLFKEKFIAWRDAKALVKDHLERAKNQRRGHNDHYTFQYPNYDKYERHEHLVARNILESGMFAVDQETFEPKTVTFKITPKGVAENPNSWEK